VLLGAPPLGRRDMGEVDGLGGVPLMRLTRQRISSRGLVLALAIRLTRCLQAPGCSSPAGIARPHANLQSCQTGRELCERLKTSLRYNPVGGGQRSVSTVGTPGPACVVGSAPSISAPRSLVTTPPSRVASRTSPSSVWNDSQVEDLPGLHSTDIANRRRLRPCTTRARPLYASPSSFGRTTWPCRGLRA
jgi:hypothetical protein